MNIYLEIIKTLKVLGIQLSRMLKEKYVLCRNVDPCPFHNIPLLIWWLHTDKQCIEWVVKKSIFIQFPCHVAILLFIPLIYPKFRLFLVHLYFRYIYCTLLSYPCHFFFFLNICILTYKDSEGKHAGSEQTFWLTQFSSFFMLCLLFLIIFLPPVEARIVKNI